jgi:hypothetical protein
MKKIIFVSLILTLISSGSFSAVLTPYGVDNKERLKSDYGYCKNSAEEMHFWRAINIHAKSFIDEVPAIPPEHKIYLNNELSSVNIERSLQVTNTTIYKMDSIYTRMQNIVAISDQYLMYYKGMPFIKKSEYIGRIMANVADDGFDYEKMNDAVNSLSSSGYFISKDALVMQWAISRALRRHLIFHLICYGEK